MPVFDQDDPDLFAIESDDDIEWLRSVARKWRRVALGGRGRARRQREAMAENGELLTEAQVCALLHVGRDAVRRFRKLAADPLPCGSAGRRNLYDRAKVVAWMERWAKRKLEPTGRRPPTWARRPKAPASYRRPGAAARRGRGHT